MSEPTPHDVPPSEAVPAVRAHRPWRLGEAPSLGRILELALFLRVAAALAVEWYVRLGATPRVCVFPDAEYYWALAGTIREGRTYEIVEWGDIPHFALRTPGYPLFLAACRALSGDRPLAARLAQAGLGALSVWLVYRLTREVMGEAEIPPGRRPWSIPLTAALLAAVHPYSVAMSPLLLSEALFVPLMVGALWGLAVLWGRLASGMAAGFWIPLAVGAASGAAILVRPSWALFVPLMIAVFCGHRLSCPQFGTAARASALVMLGLVAVMAPWWARNARVFGRFVPTAAWMGASLYDGLNPRATGGSDMSFLADPDFWPLDELDQDRRLRRRAWEFAAANPRRLFELALAKLGRYWSPWPIAEGLGVSAWPLMAIGVLVAAPILALTGLGLWGMRHDVRAWVVLAGPLLYFCGLHLVFASSMRYRVPGEAPAMGLAAVGLARVARRAGHGIDRQGS